MCCWKVHENGTERGRENTREGQHREDTGTELEEGGIQVRRNGEQNRKRGERAELVARGARTRGRPTKRTACRRSLAGTRWMNTDETERTGERKRGALPLRRKKLARTRVYGVSSPAFSVKPEGDTEHEESMQQQGWLGYGCLWVMMNREGRQRARQRMVRRRRADRMKKKNDDGSRTRGSRVMTEQRPRREEGKSGLIDGVNGLPARDGVRERAGSDEERQRLRR